MPRRCEDSVRRKSNHIIWRWRLFLTTMLLQCYYVMTTSGENEESGTNMKKFLWLTDLHLDPYYGTKDAVGRSSANCSQSDAPTLGQFGCDAPLELVQETLQQAASDVVTKDYFVILTGDLCRHGTASLDDPIPATQAILSNITKLLRQTLGDDVSIIPSLGNNDVTPDYYLDVNDPTKILSMATNGLDSLFESQIERDSFLKGGYFARNISDNIAILSLNTVVYSTSHIPVYQVGDGNGNGNDNDNNNNTDDDPLGQFQWLEDQLNLACGNNDQWVYIVGHIPPAMGSYRHSQLWETRYLQRYYAILQQFAPCVTEQLFGHLHADEFRMITIPSSALELGTDDMSLEPELYFPLWLASSVTPIYGSNPSYRWVTYRSGTGFISDYETHYLTLLNNESDGLEWKKGLSFQESFGIEDLNVNGILKLVQELGDSINDVNSPIWEALLYRQHVYVSGDKHLACKDVPCRRAWICTLETVTSVDYASCVDALSASMPEGVWARWTLRQRIVCIVVLALVAIFVLYICLYRICPRYRHRRNYQQPIAPEDEDGIVLEQGKQSNVPSDSSLRAATLPLESPSSDAIYRDDQESKSLPTIT